MEPAPPWRIRVGVYGPAFLEVYLVSSMVMLRMLIWDLWIRHAVCVLCFLVIAFWDFRFYGTFKGSRIPVEIICVYEFLED